VRDIIADAYKRTLGIVAEKHDLVEALAQKLLEVETVNHDIITEILGPRPHVNDAYRDYMEAQKVVRVQRDAEAAAKIAEDAAKKNESSNAATAESEALDAKIKAAEEAAGVGSEGAKEEGEEEKKEAPKN
jgi:hypothetical protein